MAMPMTMLTTTKMGSSRKSSSRASSVRMVTPGTIRPRVA
jgi:hypothetical protein